MRTHGTVVLLFQKLLAAKEEERKRRRRESKKEGKKKRKSKQKMAEPGSVFEVRVFKHVHTNQIPRNSVLLNPDFIWTTITSV